MNGWKTMGLNLLVFIAGALETADMTALVGDKRAGVAMMAVSVLNMGLRHITNGPVGYRKK